MKTTMDRAGRVVVPKEMRRSLQLLDGGEVEITERDGVVEIRPATAVVEIVDTPEGPVARNASVGSVEGRGAVTDAVIRETLERVRR